MDDLTEDARGRDVVAAMEPATTEALERSRWTSIGLYPDVQMPQDDTERKRFLRKLFAKQVVRDLPGKLKEPEQPRMLELQKASKTYLVTEVRQAQTLLGYIQRHRRHPFNHMKYNCTDFAVGAVRAAGFTPPGDVVSRARITSPNLLYARIWQRMKEDDASTWTAELPPRPAAGEPGPEMPPTDLGHVSPSEKKRVKKSAGRKRMKRAARLEPARTGGEEWGRYLAEVRGAGAARPTSQEVPLDTDDESEASVGEFGDDLEFNL
jgi:hypothetical protein